jgi:hypothetical protein
MFNVINFKEMTRVNFKNSVIALAIGLTVVSCGGGNSNKQSGAATPESSGQAATVNLSDYYTAVERPTVEYIDDWMLPTDGILTKVTDEGFNTYTFIIDAINKAQYDKYISTLEARGMKKFHSTYNASYRNDKAEIDIKDGSRENGAGMRGGVIEDSYISVSITKNTRSK